MVKRRWWHSGSRSLGAKARAGGEYTCRVVVGASAVARVKRRECVPAGEERSMRASCLAETSSGCRRWRCGPQSTPL